MNNGAMPPDLAHAARFADLLGRAVPHAASLEEALAAVDLALATEGSTMGMAVCGSTGAAFAHDAFHKKAQGVLNRAVRALRGLTGAARVDLRRALRQPTPAAVAQALAGLITKYRVRLASLLSATQMAALLEGAGEVVAKLPPSLPQAREVSLPPGLPPGEAAQMLEALGVPPPAAPPPPFTPALPAGDPGRVQLPLIEEAAERLRAKSLVSREVFDRLDAASRAKAFTVAGVSARETLEKIRDTLAEVVEEGADLDAFREKVLAEVEPGTFLSDAHMETVFRTSVQGAFSDGQYGIWQHPVIRGGFPYASYDAIHDDRVRDTHLALERHGIGGTNIYRVDDPVFQTFRPPWDYNDRCGWTLLTVRDAAARGVKEAQTWLATGREPSPPAFVPMPPFRPPPGFVRPTSLSVALAMESLENFVPASFGMDAQGQWHGPTPPGPGWVQVGTGPQGGKVWRQQGGQSPTSQQTTPRQPQRAVPFKAVRVKRDEDRNESVVVKATPVPQIAQGVVAGIKQLAAAGIAKRTPQGMRVTLPELYSAMAAGRGGPKNYHVRQFMADLAILSRSDANFKSGIVFRPEPAVIENVKNPLKSFFAPRDLNRPRGEGSYMQAIVFNPNPEFWKAIAGAGLALADEPPEEFAGEAAPAVTLFAPEPGPNQGPGFQPDFPPGKPPKQGSGSRKGRRKLARKLRVRKRWHKQDDASMGMVGDEWHGPQPPGPGWVEVGRGPRGGKRWKQGGSAPTAAPAAGSAPAPAATPAAGEPGAYAEKRKHLATAPFEEAVFNPGRPGAASLVYFVTVGGEKGVWKPHAGEKGGRACVRGDHWKREALASTVASLLGVDDLLPATVTRQGPDGDGSLQAFVPGQDALAFDLTARYGEPADLARAAAFDLVIGNTDRHAGNWRLTGKNRIALTDNGLSFPERQDQPEYGSSEFLYEAMNRDLPVPPAVLGWAQQAQALGQALRDAGLAEEAVRWTAHRLQALAHVAQAGGTFRQAFAASGFRAVEELDRLYGEGGERVKERSPGTQPSPPPGPPPQDVGTAKGAP